MSEIREYFVEMGARHPIELTLLQELLDDDRPHAKGSLSNCILARERAPVVLKPDAELTTEEPPTNSDFLLDVTRDRLAFRNRFHCAGVQLVVEHAPNRRLGIRCQLI